MILRAGVAAALRRDDDKMAEIIVFKILEKEMITICFMSCEDGTASARVRQVGAESKARASELFYPLDPRTKDSAATATTRLHIRAVCSAPLPACC